METSRPWFRNHILEAARYEDGASGHHLPAETEPRQLGREAKGAREPEASTGWGLWPGDKGRCGQVMVCDWACRSLYKCGPWCICRGTICTGLCRSIRSTLAFRHDVLALTTMLNCPAGTALSVDFGGWDSHMELDHNYSFRGL